jgi:hypothetical protein
MTEKPVLVRYGGVQIELARWNAWMKSPSELSETIENLSKLQRQLAEQAERHRGHQQMIRQLSQQISEERGVER